MRDDRVYLRPEPEVPELGSQALRHRNTKDESTEMYFLSDCKVSPKRTAVTSFSTRWRRANVSERKYLSLNSLES